ncbi:MAG: tyrosine-protein phosphatase [Candidatus Methanomethylophilaceae archaeon]|nr:tyrosine-protein phosphatase [Candidatus Methanomethylophilaceae archaeon]
MESASMDSSSRGSIVAAMMIVLILGSSLVTCFPPVSNEPSFSVTGEVVGLSSYNQPKLDIKAEQILDEGIELGSLFRIETETATYEDAVLVESYLGVFMFDKFVNIESDGTISIGCVGKLIVEENGSQVTITKTGESATYRYTPLYNASQSDSRDDYPSDEVFANFYEVDGGTITSGVLYRSYSPLYDPEKQSRSIYVNQLAEKAGIVFEAALSYSEANIAKIEKTLDGYCIDLIKDGDYIAPSMGYLYFQEKEKITSVLRSIIDHDGPYLIHCNAGRDRTGFAVLLIQSLCGCTEEEMRENEVRAFQNLYLIETGSREYEVVSKSTYDRNMFLIAHPERIGDIFSIKWSDVDVSNVDTQEAAYSFCTDYLGLSDDEVSTLLSKLTS